MGQRADPLKVYVLTYDDRIREAGKGLASSRYETTVSGDPLEARREIIDGYDVAVIDLEANGYAVVRDIKESKSTNDLAVVMFCERPEDVWLCRQAGAQQVLVKPLQDPVNLREAIEAAVGLS